MQYNLRKGQMKNMSTSLTSCQIHSKCQIVPKNCKFCTVNQSLPSIWLFVRCYPFYQLNNVHKRKEDQNLLGKTKVKPLLVVCQGKPNLLYLNRFIIYKSRIKLLELFSSNVNDSIIQSFNLVHINSISYISENYFQLKYIYGLS